MKPIHIRRRHPRPTPEQDARIRAAGEAVSRAVREMRERKKKDRDVTPR